MDFFDFDDFSLSSSSRNSYRRPKAPKPGSLFGDTHEERMKRIQEIKERNRRLIEKYTIKNQVVNLPEVSSPPQPIEPPVEPPIQPVEQSPPTSDYENVDDDEGGNSKPQFPKIKPDKAKETNKLFVSSCATEWAPAFLPTQISSASRRTNCIIGSETK